MRWYMLKKKYKSEENMEKQIKQKLLTLRLDEPTINWLKEIADTKGMGTSTLARMWLLERLSSEKSPSTGEWV